MNWATVLEHWLAPAGFLVVVGAVVWGIQLNVAVMRLTSGMSRLESRGTETISELDANTKQIARIAIILDQVEKRMEKFEEKFDQHEKEAMKWHAQVIALEAKLEANGNGNSRQG